MQAIAFNGSPRKGWNTHTLLSHCLDGAKSNGSQVELVNLYEYKYMGCISCFACKRHSAERVCAVKDDLRLLLEKALNADILFLGSPIYMNNITSGMAAFLERLIFPILSYNGGGKRTFYEGAKQSGFIFTMNVNKEFMEQFNYQYIIENYRSRMEVFFNGPAELLLSHETLQFDDYEKYETKMFDAKDRKRKRKEQFPLDCAEAVKMGAKLASAK